MLEGVWLGRMLDIGENIVATPNSILRARVILRRPDDEAWAADTIINIVESPGFLVPGRMWARIPVGIAAAADDDDDVALNEADRDHTGSC